MFQSIYIYTLLKSVSVRVYAVAVENMKSSKWLTWTGLICTKYAKLVLLIKKISISVKLVTLQRQLNAKPKWHQVCSYYTKHKNINVYDE